MRRQETGPSPHNRHQLIRQRRLPATRIGRAYRIGKRDLEAFLLANSTRAEVREALFRRVLQVAGRNPGVSSKDLLEELERMDEQRRLQAKSA